MTVAGLLLAAGGGRRMGTPKALVRLDGELLVERGVRLLRDGGCSPVVVVLGARADEVPPLDARVVVNPEWEAGMGSSLRAGLAQLDADAVVVALVDQPLITPEAVRRLVAAWEAEQPDAVVATYAGQRRNPVLLSALVWAGVAQDAVGDAGARAWLRGAYDAHVVDVACDDAGSPVDVDTPEQLAALRADSRSLAWN